MYLYDLRIKLSELVTALLKVRYWQTKVSKFFIVSTYFYIRKQYEDFTFGLQAWQGRKRQARGHHSPSSIQGEWLTIDDQKNNILASLCLASYLAVNWLQKLETKHCIYYAEVISVLVCVCVCVCVCVFVCLCVCVCVISV